MNLRLWLLAISFLTSGFTWGAQQAQTSFYSFVDKIDDPADYQRYLSKQNAPNLSIRTQCPKNGNNCWQIITNDSGKTLKSFSSKTSVGFIAKNRYPKRAYLYFSETYSSGDHIIKNYYLIDDRGRMRDIGYFRHDHAIAITPKGEILALNEEGFYKNGQLKLDAFDALLNGEITLNLSGEVAIIAQDKAGKIYVSSGKKWIDTQASFASNSDRNGVLAAYPNGSLIHFSFYKYINSYNKGLVYGVTNLTEESTRSGWLYNSDAENIGFSPFVYKKGSEIIVNAENSTTKQRNHFAIPLTPDFDRLEQAQIEHIRGFEQAKKFNLLGGYGVSSLAWRSKTSVGANSEKHADTQYDISDSLYHGFWFQGKYNNTQLAISYGKQQAEKKGGNTAKASKLLNMLIDFNGLFSPSSSLRFSMEQANLNGIATTNAKPEATRLNNFNDIIDFETKLTEYNLLVMKERGYFWGASYREYHIPSTIGFSGRGRSMRYVAYDPDLTLKKYGIAFGYDELSYAQRYENKLNRFYVDSLFGFSYVDLGLSSEIKKLIKAQEDKLDRFGALSADMKLDFGYIRQSRSKKLRGLGYSLTAGYRIKGGYIFAGQNKDEKLEPNEVRFEFERFDIWHGFFVTTNIVY